MMAQLSLHCEYVKCCLQRQRFGSANGWAAPWSAGERLYVWRHQVMLM